MSDQTVGDEQSVECPWCGESISFRDAMCDGCLKEGFEDVCPHCDKAVEIAEVEYTPTVWLRRAKEATDGR